MKNYKHWSLTSDQWPVISVIFQEFSGEFFSQNEDIFRSSFKERITNKKRHSTRRVGVGGGGHREFDLFWVMRSTRRTKMNFCTKILARRLIEKNSQIQLFYH